MLRRTQPSFIFIHQLGPCKFHSWKPTNMNINKLIMKIKERSKMVAYNGHYLMKQYDRELYWAAMGGPRHVRAYVREAKTARTFEHYNTKHGTCNVFMHNKFGHQYMSLTGTQPLAWSGQHIFHGPQAWLDWSNFGRHSRTPRDTTNRALEEWGIKVVNIDSKNAPRVSDLMAHKHKIYTTNFPWIKDPVTNRLHGDADYLWKGAENFDYAATRAGDHAAYDHSVMQRIEPNVSRKNSAAPKILAAQTKAAPAAAAAKEAPAAAAKEAPAAAAKEEPAEKADKKKA